MLPWGKGDVGKMFLLLPPICSNLYVYFLVVYWNISPGNLDLHKVSFVFFGGSWTMADLKTVHGPLQVTQPQVSGLLPEAQVDIISPGSLGE